MSKRKVTAILLPILLLIIAVLPACGDWRKGGDRTHYTMDLVVDDVSKTVSLTQTVDFVNSYDIELSDIRFHLYPQAFRDGAKFPAVSAADREAAYPNGFSSGGISVEEVKVNGKAISAVIGGQDEDILIVPLSDLLMPSRSVRIEIQSRITVPNVRHRFGWADKTLNLGNFYPIACVYEEGKWAEDPYYSWGDPFYSSVADYTVSVTYPEKYAMAASGKSESQKKADSLVKTTSAIENARDFAIVLGDFKVSAASADGVEFLYYYTADPTPELSIAAAVDSVKSFSELFGAYPYKSFSVVETAFLNGGMEYPGLVYISDRLKGELYREVIIHETAHQWWYAVVGNDQVKNGWLDEALTEYSVSLFYEKNPSYNHSYQNRISDAMGGYALYSNSYSRAPDYSGVMQRPLGEFKNSLEYTYMAYVKGHIMYDSLRASIGMEAFSAGLKAYYAENSFKIATPGHLIAAFENASGKPLAPFFESWIEGKTKVFG